MIFPEKIDRRTYLKRMVTLSKRIAMLTLIPSCSSGIDVKDSPDKKALIENCGDVSLREYAKKKLHHGKGRFLNPFEYNEKLGGLAPIFKWKLFSENKFRVYYKDEKVVNVNINWESVRNHSGISVTFLKHSTILIKDRGTYILVDPVFFRFIRTVKDFTPLGFDINEMPVPDHILITHGHRDHLDINSLKSLERDTHIITPLGYDEIFQSVNMLNRTQLDWYEKYCDGKREIILLPCHHWTMRDPIEGPNLSLWGSYLMKTATGKNIFISGDTAYFDHFEEIGRQFKIDLAIMNLGAYEPRWFMKSAHMNPEETVRAFRGLNADRLMVVHWGTFRLGDEPVHFPPLDIDREMKRAGLSESLVKIVHGETFFM